MSASQEILLMPGLHVPIREATAYGEGPKYLIRDNDGKFGLGFERVAKTSRIEILKTPYHVPQANAICERFLGSVRRECLDHLLVFHEKQLQRVLNAYVRYAQPSQAASRDQAADSGAESCIGARKSHMWQGPRIPDPGWFTS
jgi:transposase InsO family protein